MSVHLVAEITCDVPNCPTPPIRGGEAARAAGWELNGRFDLCPDHHPGRAS